ncbi:WecB/TagA/CpsF family glycosyltransferase [Sporosarcina highlanderae]|uniref:N-acetylglucosaminyldiphosphoundecaprenol N-acetyl-beta-D-mannosaminyltransferase n=1 Tax=Sporosarcina highlanderae TaxID=3035916 RepID=A0ABT8JLB9_9BACL|nr:WecB/TagA/CpsF family glycosyltransferase [Sporosarcina highlanderae]MDN4605951.1 WecB/TagA/CpsF family glycosyltransferase [Sporosarcina highlanderae]
MKETYLGVHVSPLTYEGIINEIKTRMTAGQQSTIIAVNPEKVMAAQKNPEVKQLINGSTFQIPDGVGILLASKMKNGKIQSRVTGVDMMARLLKFAADENHPIYLYGAKNEVVQKAAENIKQQNPGITIAGITDGYEQDEEALIQRINESGAEIIFVALGSPKQELWIKRNMDNLKNVLVFQGVGGSFDVFSGTVKRAPALFRNTGTEWLYRLASDPKRIKRQMNLPLFLMNILFNRRN